MDTKNKEILKIKLQKEYEKLIESKWKFLYNTYDPIDKKYHRTEIQEIKHIDKIKKKYRK